MKRSDFLKTLESDPGTETYNREHNIQIESVKKRFLDDLRSGKQIKTALGFFGPETEGSDAYIKDIIKPDDGGTYIKAYGCSFLYKGTFDADLVHGIQMAKTIFSDLLIKLMKMPPVAFGFLLMFLFARNKLVDYLRFVFVQIHRRVMVWYDIPEKEYNNFTKEIKRAVKLSINENNTLDKVIWEATKFFCLVLETDNTYRFRLQDALYEAHLRGNLTVLGILEVLIERETSVGVAYKWKLPRLLARFMLPIYPSLNRIVKKVLANMDMERVKMDASDWYFCLLFKSYNFAGKSVDERFAEKQQIDKDMHHVFLV